ncbi:hypothetical protein J2S00_000356 [Caldalkalibacillus uzonensis]|uniref:DUF4363 family protein n=1 Tax=Caldalkalibacillus uzonensis TaxID=353224 RepID=A0ABU0CME2_9BACI|nr:DUF4363 family protein [Caldalkalibacillus uzonensis]MDQ0337586.1 hypothetical protein [Caldalkalibacillus uzonensis]
MWRKWLLYIVPTLFLALSISVMAGGKYLKQPFGEDDKVYEAIQQLETLAKNKDWEQARERIDYASKAWQKVVNRIQFSVERETVFEISGALARMKGSVEAEDDQALLVDIYYFYELWDSLGS